MKALLGLMLVLAACGGGGGLDRHDVENLPPGNGTGSALSGEWTISRRITSCSGSCRAGVVSVCDVGVSVERQATVTQTDGKLVVDVDDDPPHLEGGVDADGHYHLGGYSTAQGATIELAALVDGTGSGDTMTGTATAHVWGSGDGFDLDCDIEDTVTATRNP